MPQLGRWDVSCSTKPVFPTKRRVHPVQTSGFIQPGAEATADPFSPISLWSRHVRNALFEEFAA